MLHPSRPEVLGLRQGDTLRLPHHLSDNWIGADQVLAELRALGLEAVMLRPAHRWDSEDGQVTILYVLTSASDRLPAGARWLDLTALRAGALSYLEPDALITLLVEDAEPARVPVLRPAWARRGWLSEMKTWLTQELARLGRTPVGEPEQIKHWSLSAVLRQRTVGGVVYIKAVQGHFIAEPRITAKLAELFPEYVPQVLALDAQRGWLLLEPLRGDSVNNAPHRVWCEARRRHGRLQLASLAYKDALLAAGCADRSLTQLEKALPQLLQESLELDRLSPEERKRLLALEPQLLGEIDDLAACGLPETLVHGDLHFGNIVYQGDGLTFFDWTDACFSHPFFDVVMLKSYDRSPEASPELRDAYLEPWRERFESAPLERALRLAERVGLLFYAESFNTIYRAQEPASRWELGGIGAYYLRRLLEPS